MSSRIPFKKCAIILFLCFFFVASFQITSLAACSHSSLGTQYCEADHPHAYYKTCKSCGQKVYTGGYATKAHGDGSRGSGTCPSCGTHSYGTTYSEATHPHRYYQSCVCGDKRYTGGYATKAHGDGSWGSGTCPSCGSHTYIGQTCTSPGTCACGATIAASSHTFGSTTYYESSHPHKIFKQCTKCGYKSYTGTQKTLAHGDGSSGTCKKCGEHSWSLDSSQAFSHPHRSSISCSCGEVVYSYTLSSTCLQCRSNLKTSTNTESKQFIFTTIDGDLGIGTVLTYVGTFSVTCMNEYKYPAQTDISSQYNYPPFASFGCSVSTEWQLQTSTYSEPSVNTVAHHEAKYYNSNSSILRTQELKLVGGSVGVINASAVDVLTLDTIPSYVTGGAGIGVVGSTQSDVLYVNAYFN